MIQVTLMKKVIAQITSPDLYAIMQNLEAKPEDFNIVPSIMAKVGFIDPATEVQ
jgi:hypothetical protein